MQPWQGQLAREAESWRFRNGHGEEAGRADLGCPSLAWAEKESRGSSNWSGLRSSKALRLVGGLVG